MYNDIWKEVFWTQRVLQIKLILYYQKKYLEISFEITEPM
jgi:hypothetical protein